MADRYANFAELAKSELEGRDFRILERESEGVVAVIAPHGGSIEPGTSEIADAIAGDHLAFCAFEGIKSEGNSDLHITSIRFDEPRCINLVKRSPWAIAIHGEQSNREVVFVGGRDSGRQDIVWESIAGAGFTVESHENSSLNGQDKRNVCNLGKSGAGIQLELSNGLRATFFESLSRIGRRNRTGHFRRFVVAVRSAIGQEP